MCLISFSNFVLQSCEVISLTIVEHHVIGLIGTRSTHTLIELIGISFVAAYNQPHGAAQRSIQTLAFEKKLYFLFN